MAPDRSPLGVVLAGGAGRRLGGDKAGALLGGRPLVEWVTSALGAVLSEVVVVARPETEVGGSVAAPVWREPADGPRHPLAGIAWALSQAGGRAVLACAVDLPFVDSETLVVLRDTGGANGPPIVLAAGQPLLGRYGPSVAGPLRDAAVAGAPTRATVGALGAVELPVRDPRRTLFNVNTEEDLRVARGWL